MSAARRKLGRSAGDRDRFGDFIERAELDFRQARRAIAPRRPYNNGAGRASLRPAGILLGGPARMFMPSNVHYLLITFQLIFSFL
jgi:hypothetical protein